jgi:16S rRNA (uracil1498-N3)-methyltransferase
VNLFYQPGIPEGTLFLDQEESRHCVKVLRHSAGDVIRITDGNGYFYTARITRADARQCDFSIQDTVAEPARTFSVHIAISPTKNTDRLEWFVEKATEFGIDTITPIECKHTERAFLKKERLEKVAVSAMKQSLKARVPVIAQLTTFSSFVSGVQETDRFIAFVDPRNPHHLQHVALPHRQYVILIGPEGDFSTDELTMAEQHGFRKVSLGPSRLRTETAGLAACHILNLLNS